MPCRSQKIQLKRHHRRLGLLSLFAVLLVADVLTLQRLDYSKGWLDRTSVAEELHPADPLRLGKLSWDPHIYANSPQLGPFLALVRDHCPSLRPIETTRCLSNFLAARFSQGAPRHDLFDEAFVPIDDLNRHLAGEPGHCVSRSGIIATAMLAAGMPARVVQLRPLADTGHNALEVYDPEFGWIFFDPSFGGELKSSDGRFSAVALLASEGRPQWIQSAKRPDLTSGLPSDWKGLYAGATPQILRGHLIYPEPWLYTRVGPRLAPAPFRARFHVVGPRSLRLAFGRMFLHGGIVLTAMALLVLTAQTALSWRRREPATLAVQVKQY